MNKMQEALQHKVWAATISTASTLHLNCDAWEAELWVQQLGYIGEHDLCISFFLWGNKTENGLLL